MTYNISNNACQAKFLPIPDSTLFGTTRLLTESIYQLIEMKSVPPSCITSSILDRVLLFPKLTTFGKN